MYVDTSTINRKGQTYKRILLRESYRENGKVKKRNIANLSSCSDKEVNAIKLALQHKDSLVDIGNIENIISLQQGNSIGSVWLIKSVADRLGITSALGNSRQSKLALWQIIARVIDQGSRLSAVRLAGHHAACDVLDLDGFHEDHLYSNLDWLSENQEKIENRLFQKAHNKEKTDVFLYDVTSSYLEGEKNEYSAFGYCRDKKTGKRQIVIGLLCDKEGSPLSIEVFPGNTNDTKTFANQVKKAADRFGGGSVTFVGDKGMIKSPQIKYLESYDGKDFYYITSIIKTQIEQLLKQDIIQMTLFDENVGEIETHDNIRYVLRRNPVRAQETQKTREDKYESLLTLVDEQNCYLKGHARAFVKTSHKKIEEKAKKLKIFDWITISSNDRIFSISKKAEQVKEIEKLDGCYVIKTNLLEKTASKEIVHSRYKDLSLVEWAFRTSKTVQLEIRPIHVRLKDRTKGHAFVVMMAYLIVRELASCWHELDITVSEGIKELNQFCAIKVNIVNKKYFHRIPEPRKLSKNLLDAANVKLPVSLPSKGIQVVTKKKIMDRRKSL